MSTTQRAALYFRQSLDVQEGIDRQRTRCRSLAAARGWTVTDEYSDNDTSATKARGQGTAWARLLADATAGKFDVVVAVDLDRLVRTVRDLVTLTETGAKVLTVDGEIDLTTADGEFRATMLAGIARFEARRKGERQKRANAARASNGKRSGGRRPFGYDQDGMTVRPVEAAAIREGYASVLAGVPLAEIARSWNDQGLVSGQERYKAGHKGEPSPWRNDSVRVVLLNPRYMGKRAHLGEIVADAEWPALVEDATWLAVSATLNNPARNTGKSTGRYLLSGLAVCGVCGANAHAGANARPGIRAYRCSGSTGHFARKAEPVEDYVRAVIVGRLTRPDARELLSDTTRPDIGALRDEANGVRARLDALAVDFADGTLTASQLRAATGRLRELLTDLETRLADAGRVDILGPLIDAEDVGTAWDTLSVARQRAIVGTLARVTLHPPGRGTRTFRPETVAIEWLS
ncbi:recombinase family protein [Cryobacterium sp. RTS3]|uniref:recombinase family protein n=1 Tax=Cryobacterium sp. RTS3 TaxID=3048643 RepID=UPI002B23D9A6|nr:recombinase family protein [Cryobacterium sp. RTS3]MEA9997843.1 recombinase family protein [Cryobacterium sp. RTS3]